MQIHKALYSVYSINANVDMQKCVQKSTKNKRRKKEFQKQSHWSFGFFAKQHTHSFRQNNLVWLILLPCSWFHADASMQQIVVANNPGEIPVFWIGIVVFYRDNEIFRITNRIVEIL